MIFDETLCESKCADNSSISWRPPPSAHDTSHLAVYYFFVFDHQLSKRQHDFTNVSYLGQTFNWHASRTLAMQLGLAQLLQRVIDTGQTGERRG